jgi:hypothetical protein
MTSAATPSAQRGDDMTERSEGISPPSRFSHGADERSEETT